MLNSISELEIQLARQALSRMDPALAKANELIPLFGWRTRARGFSGLVRLILEQQVSVTSANAIWNRFEMGLGIVNPKQVLTKTIDELKEYGLSTSKARYVYGIAQAHENGQIDFDQLKELNDDAASAKLIGLHGIGRWTAEIYLMFCEGRTDVFPAGDIALQEAIRILDGVAYRPSTDELYMRSKQWSPYRSFAAHMLWSYYRAIKNKTILMPQDVPILIRIHRPVIKKKS